MTVTSPWHHWLVMSVWIADQDEAWDAVSPPSHEAKSVQLSSVAQLCPTLCDPKDCSTPGFPVYPEACSNSCPLSRWCYPTISSPVIPFSSHLQCFPASGSFPVSQFFTSGGQIIGVSASASVLPMNIQHWFPLGSRQNKPLEFRFNPAEKAGWGNSSWIYQKGFLFTRETKNNKTDENKYWWTELQWTDQIPM